MKNIILIFVFTLFFCSNIEAKDVNEVFEKANDLYLKGNYVEANSLYKSLISSNVISSALFYNLASSYAMLGSNGYAMTWYERALRLSPLDKDINMSLSNFNGKKSRIPFLTISKLILSVLFLISFSILILVFLKKRKKASIILLISSIIIFVILFLVDIKINKPYIIILNNETALHKGSSIKSDVLTLLYEGNKLELLEEYNDWYYVKTHLNRLGWIKKDFSRKI